MFYLPNYVFYMFFSLLLWKRHIRTALLNLTFSEIDDLISVSSAIEKKTNMYGGYSILGLSVVQSFDYTA